MAKLSTPQSSSPYATYAQYHERMVAIGHARTERRFVDRNRLSVQAASRIFALAVRRVPWAVKRVAMSSYGACMVRSRDRSFSVEVGELIGRWPRSFDHIPRVPTPDHVMRTISAVE